MILTLALLQDSAPATADGLATVDQVGLGLCALFALLGLWRGLWWQVMRLVGLGASVMLARALSPRLGPRIESVGDLDPGVSQGIAWVVVFVGTLVLAALLARLGKKSLEALKLGLMDRLGGVVAGLATALVLFSSALVGISYFAPEWTSQGLADTYSGQLLQLVSTRAPVLMDSPAAERFQMYLDAVPPRDEGSSDDGSQPAVH